MRFLKILLLLIFALPAQTPPSPPPFDELREKMKKLAVHHNKFSRALFGCNTEGPYEPQSCDPARATIDYGSYWRARKAAASLYDLKE